MSTFGSSVINKSNKKFALKAPQQRRRPVAAPTALPTSQIEDTVVGQEEPPNSENVRSTHSDVAAIVQRPDESRNLDTSKRQQQRPGSPVRSDLLEKDDRPTKRRKIDKTSAETLDPENVALDSTPITQATTSSSRALLLAPTSQEESNITSVSNSETNATPSSNTETSDGTAIPASGESNGPRASRPERQARESHIQEPPTTSVSQQPETAQVDEHVVQESHPSIENADPTHAQLEVNSQVMHNHRSESTEVPAHESTHAPAQLPEETTLRQLLDQQTTAPTALESSNHTLNADSTTAATAAESSDQTTNAGSTTAATAAESSGQLLEANSVAPQLDQEPETHARIGQAPVAVMGKNPPRPRKKANQASSAGDEDSNGPAAPITAKKPRKSRKKAPVLPPTDSALTGSEAPGSTSTPTATGEGEDVADGTPAAETDSQQRGRKRAVTPEGAEDIEIDPETVTMFELCKDTRQGKKSQRESEFQNIDWTEVAKRRKQAEERARAGLVDEEREERERLEQEADRPTGGPRGPQLKIVNGRAVLDADSLVVTRNAGPGEGDEVAVEESDLTKRINSHSWIYDNRRDPDERYRSSAKSDPWSEEQTDQFYDALRMFGTDFFIISKMFPGKTRRHIKLKFNREERGDPTRIKLALIGESVPMDLDVYCAATGQEAGEFKDPEALEEELRAQDEAQKQEIEQQKEEHAEAARKKQEAAKARADGKKGKKGQGKKGKKDALDAGGEDVEVGADDG